MAISQNLPIVPPLETDKKLTDFANVLQRNLTTLFQAGHVHVGVNGVLTAAPTSSQGSPGDILVGLVGGSAYLYFKVSKTAWYRLGPATAV